MFLVFVSTVSGCVSISVFDSLVGVPVRITSTSLGLKICGLTAGIEKYKSVMNPIKPGLF